MTGTPQEYHSALLIVSLWLTRCVLTQSLRTRWVKVADTIVLR